MKKERTEIKLTPSDIELEAGAGIVTLGSCFAQEIGEKMLDEGFDTVILPFGIAFHPTPLFRSILLAIEGRVDRHRFRETEKGWISLDYQGKLYSDSPEGLEKVIEDRQALFLAAIDKAKLLTITMGTSWGYHHRETDEIVANCHRIRQAEFDKVLTSIGEKYMLGEEAIQHLELRNPDLQIIFTVSPVRHWKDGALENQRSKARLVELAHNFCDFHERCQYFPSYEIMVDELRDYKWYKEDLLHPNEAAVDVIWERFRQVFLKG